MAVPLSDLRRRAPTIITRISLLFDDLSSQVASDLSVQGDSGASTIQPWPVDAIRLAVDGSRLLPHRAEAVLVVRVGEPHGRARGGWRRDIRFDIQEGYAAFKEKCLSKFNEVLGTPEAVKRPIQLPENVGIYLKRARNDSQEKYVLLTPDNFTATLHHRWKLLTPGDLARIGDFRFEAFLYVQRATPPEQFHRATAQRIQNARVQRMAYEATNSIAFGAITAHHLDVIHARRPDGTAFEVPSDNTTSQAIALGQTREALRREDDAAESTRQTGVVTLKFNGLWMPFNPTPATNPTMEDVDHLEDEEMQET
ncbi:hypothetical protein GN244_ATG18068 [Phytophthora infestans]|uniref:Uncharacterized protein n=1 Tax=Phytophthora infestans TaxID=4787 RepID=A0A833S7W1_PHYIN|nr:hypothetical protein GN244_ATG18068 [Phytophthora infestans]